MKRIVEATDTDGAKYQVAVHNSTEMMDIMRHGFAALTITYSSNPNIKTPFRLK